MDQFKYMKNGRRMKTCMPCRHKNMYQNQKTDQQKMEIREKAKANREKRMQDDPEGTRQLEADKGKAQWEINRNNIKYRVPLLKRAAIDRNYVWDVSMTDDVCESMMTGPCFYCYSKKELNGIDRMNNFRGYYRDNCVGCCKTCNHSKLCLDAHTFVIRCRRISAVQCRGGGVRMVYDTSFTSAWPDSLPSSFATYKYCAKKKQRVFEITVEEYSAI